MKKLSKRGMGKIIVAVIVAIFMIFVIVAAFALIQHKNEGPVTIIIPSGTTIFLGRALTASFCCPANARYYNVTMGSTQSVISGCLSTNSTISVLLIHDSAAPLSKFIESSGCFSFSVAPSLTYNLEFANLNSTVSAVIMTTQSIQANAVLN